MSGSLVLSIFPGIDLLGRAFEEEGYCVVRGPDLLWGGDIRDFHPPAGVFEGVIGGPPCQAFSRLRYLNPLAGARSGNLIPEFERVVAEAQPEWWFMENVPEAPIPRAEGYWLHHFAMRDRWVNDGQQERPRRISWGSKEDVRLDIEWAALVTAQPKVTVLAGHGPVGRGGDKWKATPPIEDACEAMGLPRDFTKEMPFTMRGKRSVIGNGVPMAMGRAIAKAVKRGVTKT